MNQGRYRVIFNKATGVFAAVSELAKRHAKSTTSGEHVADVSAISGFFARFSKVALCIALLCNGINIVSAQIVADPNAKQQPNVTTAPNNVPNVQIVAPNAAGVSHNQYNKFNVDQQGAILSNNPNAANTRLGGWVEPNQNLQQSGAAKVIVNEVTSTSKTVLKGYLEVAGQKADVVVSNPNGISVGNFGFINTRRGVLTTGTPVFGGTGSLEAFRVEQGKITIEQGKKLNDSITEQTDLIARSVQINGEIWANQLNVVAGSNKVDYADLGVTVIKGKGSNPQVAIDVAVLGGLYANKINLVGTEAGVGVTSYGAMVAHVNNVQIKSGGKVNVGGKTVAAQDIIITSSDSIANQFGGVLHAKGDVKLVAATDIRNTGLIVSDQETNATAKHINNEGRIYGDTITLSASGQINNGRDKAGDHAAGVVAAHDTLTLAANEVNNKDGALLLTESGMLKIHGAGGEKTRANTVTNASSKIDAGSDLVINTKELNNTNTHYKTGEKKAHEHIVEYEINGKIYNAAQVKVEDNGDYQYLTYTDDEKLSDEFVTEGMGIGVRKNSNTTKYYTTRDYVRTTTETVVTDSKPGELIARGDITLSGKVKNDKSIITASGDIKGKLDSLESTDGKGHVTVRDQGASTRHSTQSITELFGGEKNKFWTPKYIGNPVSEVTTDLILAKKTDHDASLKESATHEDKDAASLLSRIDSQLYGKAAPEQNYLIETDPAFTHYATFVSSDYLLKALGITGKKHLGDGYYEQKMVMEQIIRLTGRRDLKQGLGTEEQYQDLMDAALAVQGKLDLKAGMALTPVQQAALTHDIVWMVSQKIKLPNGKTTEVLSPVVYLAQGNIKNSPTTTAMMTAHNIAITANNKINNSGLIAADNNVSLSSGQDIANVYGGIYSDGQDGRVSLDAKGNIKNASASIRGATVDIKAGKDVVIATRQQTNTGINGTNINLDRVGKVTGGNVGIAAGNNLVTHAANLFAAGDLVLDAQGNLALGALTTRQEFNVGSGADNHNNAAHEQTNGTQITAKGDITLHGKHNVVTQAANVESNQTLSVHSDGDVVVGDATQRMSTDMAMTEVDSGMLSTHYKHDSKTTASETSEGSSLSGDRVEIVSGHDVSVAGSEVVASRDVVIDAKNDIAITTGRNVYTETSNHEESTSGITLEGGGLHIGEESAENQQDYKQVTHNSSTIGSLVGNVTMKAGQHYGQRGSNVIANKGDVTIAAQSVDIVHATETTDSKQQSKTQKVGISAGVTSSLVSAVQGIAQTEHNYEKTKNGRAQVLAVMAAGGQVFDLYKDATKQFEFLKDLKGLGDVGSLNNLQNLDAGAGVDASISLGASKTESHSEQHDSTVKGSAVKAGGDIKITATGAGKKSDVTIIGSDIKAGGNAHLQADNSVDILAGQNTHSSHSYNKSLGGSIGYSVQKGWNGSISAGRGMSDGDAVNQTNSHVSSGGQMTLSSGGNTTIAGGVVSGKQVTANVGGDMFIESLQDKRTYSSLQQSIGIEVTQNQGGSVSASQSSANGTYAGVAEQSGIKAGDGGFTVNVKGNTDLKGAVIASSAKAVDAGRNSLTTGTLTTSDIYNHDDHSAESISANLSTSGGSSAGLGSDTNNEHHSVTASGISGARITITDEKGQLEKTGSTATETIADLKRDVTSEKDGNQKLSQGWSQESLQHNVESVEAAAKIMQVFHQQAANKIGTYSGIAEFKLNAEADLARKQGNIKLANELTVQAKKWAEGGEYRTGLHMIAGGMVGNMGGAAGALISGKMMPEISAQLKKIGIKEYLQKPLEQVVAGLLGSLVGAREGGVSAINVEANNRQMHMNEIAWLEKHAQEFAQQEGITKEESLSRLTQEALKNIDRKWYEILPKGTDESASKFLKANYGYFKNDLHQIQKLFTVEGRQYERMEQYAEFSNPAFYSVNTKANKGALALQSGKGPLENRSERSMVESLIELTHSLGEGYAVTFDPYLIDKVNSIYGQDVHKDQAINTLKTTGLLVGTGFAIGSFTGTRAVLGSNIVKPVVSKIGGSAEAAAFVKGAYEASAGYLAGTWMKSFEDVNNSKQTFSESWRSNYDWKGMAVVAGSGAYVNLIFGHKLPQAAVNSAGASGVSKFGEIVLDFNNYGVSQVFGRGMGSAVGFYQNRGSDERN